MNVSPPLPRNEPILVPNLRAGLGCLYSSSPSHDSSGAHSYLIEFQSRNVRRKIQSLVQRECDSQKHQQGQQDQSKKSILANHSGSSMYASLSLLVPGISSSSPSSSSNYETEQLFCAQTILHRIRRMKLSEAVDFEMEYIVDPSISGASAAAAATTTATGLSCANPIDLVDFISRCNNYQIGEEDSFQYWKQFVSYHCERLSILFQQQEQHHNNGNNNNSSGIGQLINHVLQHYYNQQWNNKNGNNFYDTRWGFGSEMEEKIKGELILLVLSTVTYYNMYSHLLMKQQQQQQQPSDDASAAHAAASPHNRTTWGPLMNTLTSAMAVVGLRLRYTSLSVKNNNSLHISPNTTIHSVLDENEQVQQSNSSMSSNYNGASANNVPLVEMILQAIDLVSQITSTLSIQQLLPTAAHFIDNSSQQQQLHQLHTFITNQTRHQCIYIQLSTLPDALLGGNASGGVRGRLSIDPRCIQYMTSELSTPQTGISIVMETLSRIISEQEQQQLAIDLENQRLFLLCCERWARFVPLPGRWMEQSITYTLNHILKSVEISSNTSLSAVETIQNAFCSYLISIFESACLTVPQIIALHTGLSIDSSAVPGSQSGRKKQSSKSKKRHKEKLNSVTTNDHEEKAREEHQHRRDVACQAAMLSWEVLYQMHDQCLRLLSSSNRSIVAQGEGPIGCVCAMLSGCLPHIINHENSEQKELVAFTSSVMESLKSICSHDNASVRALSFEHIPIIHAALVQKTSSGTIELNELELCMAQKLVESIIALAENCAYPHDYFNDLSMDNDEELEIERNDVRDVLRSLTNLEKGIQHVPLLTLDFILQYCYNRIASSSCDTDNRCKLPPETAVHLLSSPSKSLQCLAENIPKMGDCQNLKMIQSVIQRAIDSVSLACQQLIDAFNQKVSMNQIFPISRLMCILLASFCPFLSSLLANSHHLHNDLHRGLQKMLGQFILVAVESLKNLPELTACSSLGNTVYDIRGAMRSPGGEDHVACIAIMRLVVESENLALQSLQSAAMLYGSDVTSVLFQLSHLHDSLHALELNRGRVFHGSGVTPKSRRVLLKSICTFGSIIASYESGAEETIKSELYRLFHCPLKTILRANAESNISHEEVIYCICEATYDLSAFPPELCSQLFSSAAHSQDSDVLRGTQIIINTVVSGYRDYLTSDEPSEKIIQWGRMRGALLALLRSCANPNFTELAVHAMKALNCAECDSVIAHSALKEQHHSSAIFHSLVVSDEVIPAGAFLIAIRDVIDKIITGTEQWNNDQIILVIASCTSALWECHQYIFSALKSCCAKTNWEDPRPTIAEAWFFSMNSLIIAYKKYILPDSEQFQHLVAQSMALCIHLIMSTRVDKEYPVTDRTDGFMSVDGPQSLALVEFIEQVLTAKGIGAPIFTLTGTIFQDEMKVDQESLGGRQFDTSLIGGALISATIFRGCSGGLPPWAIENIPGLLKSMHEACGGNDDSFCYALQAGGDMRLRVDPGAAFLDIAPGKKPAGWFFDHMKPKARDEFLQKVREICHKKDNNQWRLLKVLLKANCGGKKKATGFNLKPQPTSWESDRL